MLLQWILRILLLQDSAVLFQYNLISLNSPPTLIRAHFRIKKGLLFQLLLQGVWNFPLWEFLLLYLTFDICSSDFVLISETKISHSVQKTDYSEIFWSWAIVLLTGWFDFWGDCSTSEASNQFTLRPHLRILQTVKSHLIAWVFYQSKFHLYLFF